MTSERDERPAAKTVTGYVRQANRATDSKLARGERRRHVDTDTTSTIQDDEVDL